MSTANVDEILEQALQQPEKERAHIAITLISSLDQIADMDVELAWQNEIERRLGEIVSGTVQCIPWEDIRSRLWENARAQD